MQQVWSTPFWRWLSWTKGDVMHGVLHSSLPASKVANTTASDTRHDVMTSACEGLCLLRPTSPTVDETTNGYIRSFDAAMGQQMQD